MWIAINIVCAIIITFAIVYEVKKSNKRKAENAALKSSDRSKSN